MLQVLKGGKKKRALAKTDKLSVMKYMKESSPLIFVEE